MSNGQDDDGYTSITLGGEEEKAFDEEMAREIPAKDRALAIFDGEGEAFWSWVRSKDPSIESWEKGLALWDAAHQSLNQKEQAPEAIGHDATTTTATAALSASTSKRKQVKDQSGRNPLHVKRLAQAPAHIQNQHTGAGNTKLPSNKPVLNKTSAMEVIEGQFGTYINQSNDCTGGLMKGYGALGDTHAGAIDLVAGAGGSKARAWSHSGARCSIDKDFIEDAARVYISQKTDIDEAFGCVAGGVGNWTSRSGVGIKADQIRIVAREGIKLVTKTDLANSQCGDINSTYGIDIIAGNDDTDLQPMVRGDNLMFAFEALVDEIHRLAGIVEFMLQKQTDFNSALQQHDHQIPLPGGVFLYALPNAIVYEYGLDTMLKHFSTTEMDLAKLHINLDQWKINFLNPPLGGPVGTYYICSRWNKVN